MDEQNLSEQQDVFLRHYSKNRHRIYRFIFSVLPNEADAEDVFQQASITLWKNFQDFDQSREFYPWACGVVLHAVQNFRRAAKRRHFILNDELIALIAEEQMASSPRHTHRLELLEECVAMLRPRDRRLLEQVYSENESVGSIAKSVGGSVQTIYNRLNLIRKQLMECVNRKSGQASTAN